jgi:hypothetical protein
MLDVTGSNALRNIIIITKNQVLSSEQIVWEINEVVIHMINSDHHLPTLREKKTQKSY